MAGIIDAITSPLRSASDLVQGIVEVRDAIKLGELQVKLQAQIVAALQGATAAQTHELELGDTIRQLKTRVMELETWEAEKKRYEMRELAPNVTVYAITEAARGTDPVHYICAQCYANGKKGHVQKSVSGMYHDKYQCSACRNELVVNHPSKSTFPRRGSSGGSWMGS